MKKTILISLLFIITKVSGQACATKCPTFNGQNSYISLANSTNLLGSSGTFESWVYVTSINSQYNVIMCQDLNGGGTAQTLLFFYYGQLKLRNNQGSPSSWFTLNANSSFSNNQWYHVALTWNNSGGSLKCSIFINGVLDASYDGSTGITTGASGSSTGTGYSWYTNNTNLVCLGGWDDGIINYPSYNLSFNGKIDDARFWSVEKANCDIINNMNQLEFFNSGTTGLQCYLQFNESSLPSTTSDITNNNYNGTLNNISTWNVSDAPIISKNSLNTSGCSPIFNNSNSLSNNGGNSYFVCNNSGSWLSNSGTLEAWIYPTNLSLENNFVFCQDLNGGGTAQTALFFKHDTLILKNNQGSPNSWFHLISNHQFSTNKWYHICATWKTNSGVLTSKIYVNGCLDSYYDGSSGITTGLSGSSSGSGFFWNTNNTHPLCVGGWDSATVVYYPTKLYSFGGQIDDARVWNTERSHNEVVYQMLNSLSTNPSGLVANYPFNSSYMNLVDNTNGVHQNGPGFSSSIIAPINYACSSGCRPASSITDVSKNDIKSNNCFIYPNPTNSVINIAVGSPSTSIQVSIYNIYGEIALFLHEAKSDSNGIVKLDLRTLASGIYNCYVKIHDTNQNLKIILSK